MGASIWRKVLRQVWHQWAARRHIKRALAGDLLHQYNLAWCLEEAGEPEAAEHWYRIAYARGDMDAAVNLAGILHDRDPVVHRAEALRLWADAAEHGDADAAFCAAHLCWDFRDTAGARRWLVRAADLGDPQAARILARSERRRR